VTSSLALSLSLSPSLAHSYILCSDRSRRNDLMKHFSHVPQRIFFSYTCFHSIAPSLPLSLSLYLSISLSLSFSIPLSLSHWFIPGQIPENESDAICIVCPRKHTIDP